MVATPLADPTSFVATVIGEDNSNPSSSFGWGAIAVSTGATWGIGTSAVILAPSYDRAGLLVSGVVAPPSGTISAFWLLNQAQDSEHGVPAIRQVWSSNLIGGTWSSATVVYDLLTTSPYGYSANTNQAQTPAARDRDQCGSEWLVHSCDLLTGIVSVGALEVASFSFFPFSL